MSKTQPPPDDSTAACQIPRPSDLQEAAETMDVALQLITGLNERDRKLVVYWNLATHALPKLNTFPLLALRGKFGTGKSQTLHIIKSFAHQPRAFSLRSRTEAAIRDELADCYEGSAIVEEADQAWKDVTMAFERMLSDRYQRASAEAAHKVFAGEKQWETVTKKYFGATVLHRRLSFNDPALDGRTVLVQFRADNSRTYQEFCEDDPWIVQGSRLAQGLTFDMPTVNQPPDIAARVFNTYAPLLGIAKLCSDDDFVRQILQRLQQETLELKEAQAEEPDGLVLRAIVEAIFERGTSETPEFRYVKFRDIAESIFRNHKVTLQPRQIGPIARELGFETKTAHGVTVVVPTLATLLKACGMCDYTDEGIEQLRREILEGESKSAAARRAKLFS